MGVTNIPIEPYVLEVSEYPKSKLDQILNGEGVTVHSQRLYPPYFLSFFFSFVDA